MKLLIQGDRVIGTALDAYDGPDLTIAAPADFDVARLGDYRVGEDGSLTLLPAVLPLPARAVTYLAFRRRFTHAERVGLELAKLDDPTASAEQRAQAASVRVYLADAAAALWIDLDDADARAGVAALQAAGLLAEGRADEIVDAPVLPEERPT